jgi:hypothetical protein
MLYRIAIIATLLAIFLPLARCQQTSAASTTNATINSHHVNLPHVTPVAIVRYPSEMPVARKPAVIVKIAR